MAKFCPNCGNQMSDNAKFCLECGTKLEDYASGGAGIKDNVITRSQVGAASVGTVAISPTISLKESTIQEGLCPKCGFKMIEQRHFSVFLPCEDFGLIVNIKGHDIVNHVGYSCVKCGYKFLINCEIFSDYACPICKTALNFSSSFLSGELGKCTTCGNKWKKEHLKTTKKLRCSVFEALEKLGWDVSLL